MILTNRDEGKVVVGNLQLLDLDSFRTVNGHKAVDMTHTTLVDFMTGLADRGQEIVMGMARSPTEE